MNSCPRILTAGEWDLVTSRLRLSCREAQVAGLALTGLTVDMIAGRLGISPDTVRTYSKLIHDKAGVRTAFALLLLVVELVHHPAAGHQTADRPS